MKTQIFQIKEEMKQDNVFQVEITEVLDDIVAAWETAHSKHDMEVEQQPENAGVQSDKFDSVENPNEIDQPSGMPDPPIR